MKNFTDYETEMIEEMEDFHLSDGEVIPAMYFLFPERFKNSSLSLIPDYDDEYIF